MGKQQEADKVTEGLKELWTGLVDTIGLELENRGLRRSLEGMLKGGDGMVPVARVQLTEQGVRELSLKLAGQARRDIDDRGGNCYDVDDILETARKFETYLLGGFIADELPKSEGDTNAD